MAKVLFSLLLLVATCWGKNSFVELTMVDQLARDYVNVEMEIWDWMKNDKRAIKKYHKLTKSYSSFINGSLKEYQDQKLDYRKQSEVEKNISKLIEPIDRTFNLLLKFIKRNEYQTVNTTILREFSLWSNKTLHNIRDKKCIDNMINVINDEKINSKVKKENVVSETRRTEKQILYNIYETLVEANLKLYIFTQFVTFVEHISKESKIDLHTKQQFYHNNYKYVKAYNEIITRMNTLKKAERIKVDNFFFMSDPKNKVLGESYTEMIRVMQGYITNEKYLNSDGWCTGSCSDYSDVVSNGKKSYMDDACRGTIKNCKEIDDSLRICKSKDTSRRYNFVDTGEGATLGISNHCTTLESMDSWRSWLVKCSNCICICDEENKYSDRYFSLRRAIADINNNRVVTGIKFIKSKSVIRPQIQEGELGPRGMISSSTLRWVPADDFNIYDRDIYEDVDYFKFDSKKRSIDLHDLIVNETAAVTGIRFFKLANHLNFEVLVTPFNFTTGKLKGMFTSKWMNNYSTEKTTRKRIHLKDPDVPIRSREPSKLHDSHPDQYVDVTHTSINKDVAQRTVPFIDTQPVYLQIPTPLKGMGVYHKGQDGYGGFVGFKIIPYDFFDNIPLKLDPHVDIH